LVTSSFQGDAATGEETAVLVSLTFIQTLDIVKDDIDPRSLKGLNEKDASL
jgi:hypothetical protein